MSEPCERQYRRCQEVMKSSVICSVGVAAAFVVWGSPAALALDKTPVLSLDLAKKIAAGCEAKAKEMSWKMNISVVDSGANQIFFEKMDGAYRLSPQTEIYDAGLDDLERR